MAKSNGTTVTCSFLFERETKGAVRYQEINAQGEPISTNDGAKIGTLYLRKSALGSDIPQKVSVSVTPA